MERDRNAGTVVPVVGADAQALAACKGQCRSGREHRVVCAVTIAELTPQLSLRGLLEWPHAESHASVRTGRPELTSRANVGAARGAADPGRPGADVGFLLQSLARYTLPVTQA